MSGSTSKIISRFAIKIGLKPAAHRMLKGVYVRMSARQKGKFLKAIQERELDPAVIRTIANGALG